MKNRNQTYGSTAENATFTRGDLPPFLKKRIYGLLGFILLVWLIALLFALADIVPLLTRMKSLKKLRDNPAITRCNPGPWGNMHYSRISIEAPESFLPPEDALAAPTEWFFKGRTKQSLTAFIDEAGLTDRQKDLFYRQSRWEVSTTGITVFPIEEFILDVTPESRAYIYQELARFQQNPTQYTPYTFKNVLVEQWLKDSGLLPEIQSLILRLSYTRGAKKAFSDPLLVLSKLNTPAERKVFYKAVSRSTSLFLQLHITRNSDIETIARYWMKGGAAKDIAPLLRSAARVEGGYDLDIMHLLPPVPRMLAYTYPNLAEINLEDTPDCHWTAANFFNLSPDSHLLDAGACAKFITSEYYQYEGKPAFGDIIMFVAPAETAQHSCNYIADDIVFTKNGSDIAAPWIFMTLEDVIRTYSMCECEIRLYRRNSTSD